MLKSSELIISVVVFRSFIWIDTGVHISTISRVDDTKLPHDPVPNYKFGFYRCMLR